MSFEMWIGLDITGLQKVFNSVFTVSSQLRVPPPPLPPSSTRTSHFVGATAEITVPSHITNSFGHRREHFRVDLFLQLGQVDGHDELQQIACHVQTTAVGLVDGGMQQLRQEQGRRGTVVLEHDGARWSTMEHDGARWSTMEHDGARWSTMEHDVCTVW
jgi:hypothetical protein